MQEVINMIKNVMILTILFFLMLLLFVGSGSNGPDIPSASCNDLPRINLFKDLNADNKITIDDASIGLKRAALSSGDRFITLICDNSFSNYFEIDGTDFGGVFSGTISLLHLLLIFYTFIICFAIISKFFDSISEQLEHKHCIRNYLFGTWLIVAFFSILDLYMWFLRPYLEYVPFPIGFLTGLMLFSFACHLGIKIFSKKIKVGKVKVDTSSDKQTALPEMFGARGYEDGEVEVAVEMFLNFKSNTILALSLLLLFMLSPWLSLSVSLFYLFHMGYAVISERERVIDCIDGCPDVITLEGVDITIIISALIISSLGTVVSIVGLFALQ